jgi:drug/metabolite transporter (DMT)-like permease
MAVAILAAIFLRERLTASHALAIAAGFGGVVVAVNPAGLFNNPGLWVVYGATFMFMLTNALQMLTTRIIGPGESSLNIAFYPRAIAVISALFAGTVMGFASVPFRGFAFSLVSGICSALGWACMARAYAHAPAATIAPFHYSQLIIGALFGYLIWGDVPAANMLVGGAIIIGSGLYIAAQARKRSIVTEAVAGIGDM